MTTGESRAWAAVDSKWRRLYDQHRLMRIYHLDHPDKIKALPAGLATWALMFDMVEKDAEIIRMNKAMGGG